ncbi:MAG: Stp1/IreP family PP2C-type Ser/Thr phosphatase [Clostridia bacterium]|nr:Stp1/IreP family PP2C-type Ser/Thr phosphatase [Clostridia bacterium]
MNRRFRFTGECLERLRAYCTIVTQGPKKAKKKKQGKEDTAPEAAAPEKVEAPAREENENDAVICRTDVGKMRKSNQDAVIDAFPVIGVADGMGGHNGGEVASASARDILLEELEGKAVDGEALIQAIETANTKILLMSAGDDRLAGMGTTLTVLWVDKDEIKIGHVGDSRAYLLRGGELKQVTRDHSMVAEMVRQGLITQEQADNHPMKNIITRAVGTDLKVDVDILSYRRKKDDKWLICSDGLSGMVTNDRLKELLEHNTPGKAADLMLADALDAGGRDNISFVIFTDKEDHEA